MSDEQTKASEASSLDQPTADVKKKESDVKEETPEAGEVDESVEAKTSEAGSPDSSGEEVEVPEEFKKLVEQVEKMSVLELHELVKVLEKRFGVSASAVAVAAPGAGGGDESGEQDSFAVELADAGGSKIQVIKVVKEILGLGLKEAKDMVDGAPAVLKEGVKKEEAEELKAKLEEAGATVNLK